MEPKYYGVSIGNISKKGRLSNIREFGYFCQVSDFQIFLIFLGVLASASNKTFCDHLWIPVLFSSHLQHLHFSLYPPQATQRLHRLQEGTVSELKLEEL
jgi:hypothetical protein